MPEFTVSLVSGSRRLTYDVVRLDSGRGRLSEYDERNRLTDTYLVRTPNAALRLMGQVVSQRLRSGWKREVNQ